MSLLPFTKMQAVGNDFVVIEEAVWGAETDWTQEAIRLCDRHKGIGGDGLLVICPSEIADVRMRMFNPDGTEDMCGNGLRCVVRWAVERGYFSASEEDASARVGVVNTLVGNRGVSLEESSGEGDIWTEMGTPLFRPDELPALLPEQRDMLNYPLEVDGYGVVTVSTVNTGSTHTVIWVDELPDDELFLTVSPKIEHHAVYPERTSVLWAKPMIDQPKSFQVRIWERGVGETLGCGTGACAIAVLAARQGKIGKSGIPVTNTYYATVRSRGGSLTVIFTDSHHAKPDEEMVLIGTAHTVYSGVIAR